MCERDERHEQMSAVLSVCNGLLRAEGDRLRAQLVESRAQVDTMIRVHDELEQDRERFRAVSVELSRRVAELEQLVHWMAQTVHQAHHVEGEDAGRTWRECQRGFCSSVRRGLGAEPKRAEVDGG